VDTGHQQSDLFTGGLFAGKGVHNPAFIDDGDAIGEGEDFIQVFGDEQDRFGNE
jgi:hypothetical protein